MEPEEVITKSARSIAASKRWEQKRKANVVTERKQEIIYKKFDWHLFISAGSVIITLGSLIFGCYFSLKSDIGDLSKEIVKIETVLILKGVAPPEMFSKDSD